MAVWYELRYPDYELENALLEVYRVGSEINNVLFIKNRYVKDHFANTKCMIYFGWGEFYNEKVFIESLPSNEKSF